jgi:hypothetical protein
MYSPLFSFLFSEYEDLSLPKERSINVIERVHEKIRLEPNQSLLVDCWVRFNQSSFRFGAVKWANFYMCQNFFLKN